MVFNDIIFIYLACIYGAAYTGEGREGLGLLGSLSGRIPSGAGGIPGRGFIFKSVSSGYLSPILYSGILCRDVSPVDKKDSFDCTEDGLLSGGTDIPWNGGGAGSGDSNRHCDAGNTDHCLISGMPGSDPSGIGLEGQPDKGKACCAWTVYAGNLCAALSVCRHTESGQEDIQLLEPSGTFLQHGGILGYEHSHGGRHPADEPYIDTSSPVLWERAEGKELKYSVTYDKLNSRKYKGDYSMINKLIDKIQKTKAPIVVGLDPMLSYIPEHIQKRAFAEFGETLEGAAEAVWQFNKEIVDKTYDLIPAVKPQIAMYEQFGIEGLKAYKKTVDYCKSKDLVVIGDVKRGDIGSTSAAYAVGHLGKIQVGSRTYTGFDEDFITVNPYLGSDGIQPFVEVCREEKKGLFILVKTSNPSSGEFQDRLIDGRPLYELVGEKVAQWGREHMGDSYSYIGAVVGATYPEMGKILRKIMPKTFILVPGYGAQGGKGKDLAHFFNEDGYGAIVNSSRGIIAAYKQEAYAAFGAEQFGDASRAAVEDMAKDIREALG